MAIQHTLFISANRLVKDTALGGTVDQNLIHPYILTAQDKYILPVLGTDLYNKIISDVNADTITGDYETLLEDYIQPALVQFAFAEILPFMRIRFVNNAIVVMGATEQSSSATYDDIKPLINNAMDTAEFYRKRLVDYLIDNTSSFAEYSTNSGSDLSPSKNAYYSGLNVDSRPSKDNLQLKAILSGIGIKNSGI